MVTWEERARGGGGNINIIYILSKPNDVIAPVTS